MTQKQLNLLFIVGQILLEKIDPTNSNGNGHKANVQNFNDLHDTLQAAEMERMKGKSEVKP